MLINILSFASYQNSDQQNLCKQTFFSESKIIKHLITRRVISVHSLVPIQSLQTKWKNTVVHMRQMFETCNCMTTVCLDIYRTCIPRQKKNCCALTRLMNCMAISVKTMILMGSWQAGLFSFLKWIKLPRQHEIIDLWIEQSKWWFVIAEFITHLAFLPQK